MLKQEKGNEALIKIVKSSIKVTKRSNSRKLTNKRAPSNPPAPVENSPPFHPLRRSVSIIYILKEMS